MGLVLMYEDKREVIPVIQTSTGLEYTITTKIKNMVQTQKSTIGIVSSESTQGLNQNLTQSLNERYQVRPNLNLETTIPENIDIVLINGLSDSLSVEEESYYTTGERIEEQNWYNGFNNTFIQNAVVENVEIDTVSHYPLIYYTLDVHALDFDNRFWFYEDYTITNSETWNLTVYPPWNDFEPGDRITPNLSQNKLIYKKLQKPFTLCPRSKTPRKALKTP